MAGGQPEEEIAERLKKPVSGTEVDGVGTFYKCQSNLRKGLTSFSVKRKNVDSGCFYAL
jgi:hypothetical protein